MMLDQIEAVLNADAVLPPGVDWKPLDAGSYRAQLPGMLEPVRATPRAEVFDDHCDSHVFLSPGGWFFEQLADQAGADGEDVTERAQGHFWLVQSEDGGVCELIAQTADGQRRISSLRELLDSFRNLGPSGELDSVQFPKARVMLLA
jgi:hypothetical protein